MRVALFWADKAHEWISSMWRMQFVHSALLGAGIESRLYAMRELVPLGTEFWHPVEDWADYIILERLAFEPWMSFVKRWQERGIPVYLSFDDAYHLIPDYMTTGKVWAEEGAKKEWTRNLRHFDGLFVPSTGLARAISKFGGKIHVIKNYPDLNHPAIRYALEEPLSRRDDRYVIGWGGSHHHSVEKIVTVLEELVEEWPQVQIWVVGNNAAFNLLGSIPPSHKRVFPRMPYGNYLAATKEFDVFAIPLVGKYDHSRSWIKPLEAALMGVPWVATYHEIYKECKGGRLVRSKAQWKEALMSPEIAATEWALEQGIADHIQEYTDVLLGGNSYLWRGRRRPNKRSSKKRKN